MLRPGDKIFYCDNGTGLTNYNGIAFRTIQDLGLIPLVYGRTGLDVRKSNLDKEIRDDFYQSKVVSLLLGKGQEWRDIEDSWAIPELRSAISIGIECFVYVTTNITEDEVRSLGLPLEATAVENEVHFETILRRDLGQLMSISS